MTGEIYTGAQGGTVVGTQDADVIYGNDERDHIFIGEGDNVYGGDCRDTLYYDGTIHSLSGGRSGNLIRISDGAVVGSYSNFERFDDQGTANMTLPDNGPTAFVDLGTVDSGGTVTVSPLDNDIDVVGDTTLTVTGITSGPSHGTAVLNPDGTITYTADPAYVGVDALTYEITDGDGNTDTAIVKFGVTVVCFTRGTMIATERGDVAIENLQVGDMFKTLDRGTQPIRWIGSQKVAATGDLAPIKIKAGTLGCTQDLMVSPQHRMLLQGWEAELLFEDSEVLVAAKMLVNDHSVTRQEGGEVEYFHMLFDTHELVLANGTWSESFHPGEVGFGALSDESRQEILELFPELQGGNTSNYGPAARKSLKSYEASFIQESSSFLNSGVTSRLK